MTPQMLLRVRMMHDDLSKFEDRMSRQPQRAVG